MKKTTKNNIAERCLAYYDHKDFKDNYSYVLFESFNNDEADMINRIIDLFNVSNYETQKELSNWKIIDRKQAKEIFDFINVNFEQFTDSFKSYWVGDTSLDSISFGEQEEQLEGLYNYKTSKPYSVKYLRRIFDAAGYYVSEKRDYAYYDISSDGLHIDLLKGKELLNQFLTTI